MSGPSPPTRFPRGIIQRSVARDGHGLHRDDPREVRVAVIVLNGSVGERNSNENCFYMIYN